MCRRIVVSRPPHVSRILEQCHDVESNPGPRPNTQSSTSSSSSSHYGGSRNASSKRSGGGGSRGNGAVGSAASRTTALDGDDVGVAIVGNNRVDRLERDLQGIQDLLSNLDASVLDLKESVENMRPAYNQAIQVLSNAHLAGVAATGQKNNLVFHGIPPDPLELQMQAEPEFCRDVLETRIKMVFREHLRISRDMPLTQVYRVDSPNLDMDENADAPKPLVVGFKSLKDKDNILRHFNLLRKAGIYITEDTTGKKAPWMKSGVTATKTAPLTSPTKKNGKLSKSRRGEATVQSMDQSDLMSSCNSDYAPSSHSGNSSSGFTD